MIKRLEQRKETKIQAANILTSHVRYKFAVRNNPEDLQMHK